MHNTQYSAKQDAPMRSEDFKGFHSHWTRAVTDSEFEKGRRHWVAEGSKVRRLGKSVKNAGHGAQKCSLHSSKRPNVYPSPLKASQSVSNAPRGRDVLLYAEWTTFNNPRTTSTQE